MRRLWIQDFSIDTSSEYETTDTEVKPFWTGNSGRKRTESGAGVQWAGAITLRYRLRSRQQPHPGQVWRPGPHAKRTAQPYRLGPRRAGRQPRTVGPARRAAGAIDG